MFTAGAAVLRLVSAPASRQTAAEIYARSPRNTDATIEYALQRERAGDPGAEAILQVAARFDRRYLPAWTLANYYFRSGEAQRFWLWARRAAALNPHDFRPLLRLASYWAPQPTVLLEHLGRRPALLLAYLDQLIAEGRLDDAAVVAEVLRQQGDPAVQPQLEAFAKLRNIPSRLPQ
jgi:hypothetical protein